MALIEGDQGWRDVQPQGGLMQTVEQQAGAGEAAAVLAPWFPAPPWREMVDTSDRQDHHNGTGVKEQQMRNVVTDYAESSTQGKRSTMEDASVVVPDFRGNPAEFLAAIYDGHHGRTAADISAEKLHRELGRALDQSPSPGAAMTQAFLATDKIIADREKEESAAGYRRTGLGGAVAVVAYINQKVLLVGNSGDAHAVLDRNGRAERLSQAHRASEPLEARRIRQAGGRITRSPNDVARVGGELAVTRSLGDTRLKEWVIAEPSIQEVVLRQGDEQLILGCDGLWDYLNAQRAVDLLRRRRITDAAAASELLVKEALRRGSDDNITTIVVHLDLLDSVGGHEG